MVFKAFDMDSRNRSRRTHVLAGAAPNALSLVDAWHHG